MEHVACYIISHLQSICWVFVPELMMERHEDIINTFKSNYLKKYNHHSVLSSLSCAPMKKGFGIPLQYILHKTDIQKMTSTF